MDNGTRQVDVRTLPCGCIYRTSGATTQRLQCVPHAIDSLRRDLHDDHVALRSEVRNAAEEVSSALRSPRPVQHDWSEARGLRKRLKRAWRMLRTGRFGLLQ